MFHTCGLGAYFVVEQHLQFLRRRGISLRQEHHTWAVRITTRRVIQYFYHRAECNNVMMRLRFFSLWYRKWENRVPVQSGINGWSGQSKDRGYFQPCWKRGAISPKIAHTCFNWGHCTLYCSFLVTLNERVSEISLQTHCNVPLHGNL